MFIHQFRALRGHKQLILTIKINNIHADELNTVRVHALRTALIYKQFTDKILI
jgi:hypothetical protein